MAPDLNAVSSEGRAKWDYSTPGSSGYEVPNHVYNDPSTRKLRILTIGAGFSGIMMAYQIQKDCENVEHVIYEKNHDIGGTWLENRYPNCACDIPSHAYTYNFALNPDWPRFFSYAPDIWQYLDKVCEVFQLRKYMVFNTEVVRMEWQEDRGQWKVTLKQSAPGQEPRIFEEHCDFLNYATGILNNYKWPNIPGLSSFKGKLIHTAAWPTGYEAEQWKSDRVAVIGSGASSIQTVPGMQPHVPHMDIYVRTGVWFVQIANNYGQNHVYSQEDRDKFRRDPRALLAHAKDIEGQVNHLADVYLSKSEAQQIAKDTYRERMREWIKDERLLKGFTPEFGVFCRRITPGDPYMLAIQKPNVSVHFTPAATITPTGIIGGDGIERACDTIICATGFDVTYKPRFPIIGRDGVDLGDKWREHPEGYLGLAVPSFPNFVMYVGPTWPVENGSVAGPLQQVAHYAVKWIRKMQRDHVRSMAPRQDVTDAFNAHTQEWYKHTVWAEDCRSWYKDNDSGRINAVWPGTSLHYIDVLQEPRWEDFEVRSMHANPWAHLGMGFSRGESHRDPERNEYSPYLRLENVDPRWLEAVGRGERIGGKSGE